MGLSLSEIKKKKAFAFCGIGNAESFFEQLRREKIDVSGTSSEFVVETFGKPKKVELDPSNRVLRFSNHA